MVAYGRVELLAHPLSQKYLLMKWNSYGKYFHVTNLLIYMVFLMFITIYASQLMGSVERKTNESFTDNSSANHTKVNKKHALAKISLYHIFMFFFANIYSHSEPQNRTISKPTRK